VHIFIYPCVRVCVCVYVYLYICPTVCLSTDDEYPDELADEQLAKFLTDVGIDSKKKESLAVCWKLDCKEQGVIYRNEFEQGFSNLGYVMCCLSISDCVVPGSNQILEAMYFVPSNLTKSPTLFFFHVRVYLLQCGYSRYHEKRNDQTQGISQ
jgi:hypothetical protein